MSVGQCLSYRPSISPAKTRGRGTKQELTDEQLEQVNGGLFGIGEAIGNKIADFIYGPLGERVGGNNRAGHIVRVNSVLKSQNR